MPQVPEALRIKVSGTMVISRSKRYKSSDSNADWLNDDWSPNMKKAEVSQNEDTDSREPDRCLV